MPDIIVAEIKESLDPKSGRRLRAIVADAFAFIRSVESNKALATVTVEDLMGDQIKRNGESGKSSSKQFDPYAFDSNGELPDGVDPAKRANFAGGSDTNRATKRDRIIAVESEISDVVREIKKLGVIEVSGFTGYTDAVETSPED